MLFNWISVNSIVQGVQCYIQWVYKAPLYIRLRIKMWEVAYFDPQKIWNKLKKKSYGAVTKTFLKDCEFLLVHKKLKKKTPSNVAQKNSSPLFFLSALSCQNDPNRRIYVSICSTVYRTGTKTYITNCSSKFSDLPPALYCNINLAPVILWWISL